MIMYDDLKSQSRGAWWSLTSNNSVAGGTTYVPFLVGTNEESHQTDTAGLRFLPLHGLRRKLSDVLFPVIHM